MPDQPTPLQSNQPVPSQLDQVQIVVKNLIANRIVPGIIVLVQKGSGPLEYAAQGVDAAGQAMTANTLFPVASISKLAAALVVLRLAAENRLALDDLLDRYLPDAEVVKESPGLVSVRSLLCHTSGLPEDLPDGAAPYRPGLDWPGIAAGCLKTPPQNPPWKELSYSNVGYGLLAVMVERLTGQSYPQVMKEKVLTPLKIEGYLGEEPPRPPAKIAGNMGDHAGTPLEPYNSPFWRSLALPYGGLVTSAEGALKLVQAFAGRMPPDFLPAALLAEARRDQTRGLPGKMAGLFEWDEAPWGLGIELRGHKTPHTVTSLASPQSFGHLGASGTEAWLDPARGISWVFLGARQYYEWWQHMPEVAAAILSN